jgi:hypothetical protein
MKVKDLIAKLSEVDGDMRVLSSLDDNLLFLYDAEFDVISVGEPSEDMWGVVIYPLLYDSPSNSDSDDCDDGERGNCP